MQSPNLSTELLYLIVDHVGKLEVSNQVLLNLLVVSRGMYQIAVRELYREIDLDGSSAFHGCCRALSSNDLAASSVQSFRILDTGANAWSAAPVQSISLLSKALLRTTNLRSLWLDTLPLFPNGPSLESAYEMLFQTTYPFMLHSLDIRFLFSVDLTCAEEFLKRQKNIRRLVLGCPLRPSEDLCFPLLSEITFDAGCMEDKDVQALFEYHPQITHVKIDYPWDGIGGSTFELDMVLEYAPNLTSLAIATRGLVHLATLLASIGEAPWGEALRFISFISYLPSEPNDLLPGIFFMLRSTVPNLESVYFLCDLSPGINAETFATAPMLALRERSWKFYFCDSRGGTLVTRDKGEGAEWVFKHIEMKDVPDTHTWALNKIC